MSSSGVKQTGVLTAWQSEDDENGSPGRICVSVTLRTIGTCSSGRWAWCLDRQVQQSETRKNKHLELRSTQIFGTNENGRESLRFQLGVFLWNKMQSTQIPQQSGHSLINFFHHRSQLIIGVANMKTSIKLVTTLSIRLFGCDFCCPKLDPGKYKKYGNVILPKHSRCLKLAETAKHLSAIFGELCSLYSTCYRRFHVSKIAADAFIWADSGGRQSWGSGLRKPTGVRSIFGCGFHSSNEEYLSPDFNLVWN